MPSNIVPEIDFSDDPLLQGWLFSYRHTEVSAWHDELPPVPINAPKCPYANVMRDGLMQIAEPKGRATYEPNSLDQADEDPGPRASAAGFTTAPRTFRAKTFGDHYSQPRMFWRSQTENEQAHIASAYVFELSKVGLDHIRNRVLSHLANVDDGRAQGVADGLGVALSDAATPFRTPVDYEPSAALSIQKNWKETLQGRKIGLLFGEGSDKVEIDKLIAAIKAEGGSVFTIAPKIGVLTLKAGEMRADGQLAGSPSPLFDAIAMILALELSRMRVWATTAI